MKGVARILLLALAVYAGLVLLVWVLQRRMQYFPGPGPVALPREAAQNGLREVTLTTSDDVALEAWWWPGDEPLTFVLFHGNAGHRGDRIDWIRALRGLGAGVFALDYRGYGGSEGSPSEAGLYRDGEAALDWLRANDVGPLVFIGESLGCGVAVEMARRHGPAALILVSPYPSLVEVAAAAYPWLPVGWLMRDRFESASKLAGMRVPLLCVHGSDDAIIPPELGATLFAAADGPKEWWQVPGRNHNDVVYGQLGPWTQRAADFLRRHALLQ